jgi:hypothetical protein
MHKENHVIISSSVFATKAITEVNIEDELKKMHSSIELICHGENISRNADYYGFLSHIFDNYKVKCSEYALGYLIRKQEKVNDGLLNIKGKKIMEVREAYRLERNIGRLIHVLRKRIAEPADKDYGQLHRAVSFLNERIMKKSKENVFHGETDDIFSLSLHNSINSRETAVLANDKLLTKQFIIAFSLLLSSDLELYGLFKSIRKNKIKIYSFNGNEFQPYIDSNGVYAAEPFSIGNFHESRHILGTLKKFLRPY